MCFRKCKCGTELNMHDAATHECWELSPRPWRVLETVQNGGDLQVLIELLAAEIDVLRQQTGGTQT